MEWTTYIPRCPLCNSRGVYECILVHEAHEVSFVSVPEDKSLFRTALNHGEDILFLDAESIDHFYCKACRSHFDQPTLERVEEE
jgi:hypothetical protein